jgi:hypothetical protein
MVWVLNPRLSILKALNAVLPELKESNIEGLKPSSYVWITNNHQNSKPKGLGVLAFNGIELISLPRDEDMEIYIPLEVKSPDLNFNLLAVWNFYSACKQGRFKGVKGEMNGIDSLEWTAMKHYANFLKDPALMVGDWNFGPTFSQAAFIKLCKLMSDLDIESLYHNFNNLTIDQSNHPTFKTTRKNFHHLDHIFGSDHFADSMTNLTVGSFDDVVLSDHTPMLLETK